MLKVSTNIVRLFELPLNSWYPAGFTSIYGSQSVRWTKPRWIPKAPSKMYVVTHRKRHPPKEAAEVLRLYQNYKCFMRLTYEHLNKEYVKLGASGKIASKIIEEEEEEHKQLMEYNAKENERLDLQRKERHELEKAALIKEIHEFKAKEAERASLARRLALQKLQETEELVVTFIDPENLTKAIEDALNNPTDYNYSIDTDGRMYKGRMTLPHLVDKRTLQVLEVKDEGFTSDF